jgi:hypothetical protein
MGIYKKIRRRFSRLLRIVAAFGGPGVALSALRESSTLLDPAWYRRSYGVKTKTPVEVLEHYRAAGCSRGYDPNPLFDTNWYRANYRKLLRRAETDP